MKIVASIMILAILMIGSSLSYVAYAKCPSYTTNLVVTYVNVDPHQVSCGGTINITVGVQYPDGTPAMLWPETLSFVFAGPGYSLVLGDVQVFPTGRTGFYAANVTCTCSANETSTTASTRTSTIWCNLTTTATTCYTTGTTTICNGTCPFPSGTVSVSVLGCSCRDENGNYGPSEDTGSDKTLTPNDNSIVNINPQTVAPENQQLTRLLASYGVPIAIVIVIVFALLALAARHSRKPKT